MHCLAREHKAASHIVNSYINNFPIRRLSGNLTVAYSVVLLSVRVLVEV